MPVFKVKRCKAEGCEKEYQTTGPAAKFCPECSIAMAKERSRVNTQKHRVRTGKTQKPGVGKGGNNAKGSEDSQYRNGIGFFMSYRRRVKDLRGSKCERCSKCLLSASRYEWVIHHRDHDRSNNCDENFELLCKRCHQLEHDCESALPNEKV